MKPEYVFGFLDEYLGHDGFPDYSGAENGLQVEGAGRVTRIGAAVDASERVLGRAAAEGVDLLLVHHGLFWDPRRPLTGRRYRKAQILIESGMAVYSSHLPLDAHPEVGNCAVLMRALGWGATERFGEWKGVEIGWRTSTAEPRDRLAERLGEVVGGPVQILDGGPDRVEKVGLVTGGGGSFIAQAAEAGLDTLITGEGAHHTYVDAMELGVNVLYAGHYATETWGVRALAEVLSERFGLPWHFLDDPSSL
ncbi:MAG: Nif3-like dinuclear metal center hexameric protein [Gemmatimonadales bacterium]|nr:MAG: Nif3-like dinuclear metal center hexameric protein [Gemmatimonadales bacterium]